MADLLQRPALRLALLVWVGLFFALIVPLHHRGVVALPGAVATETSAPYCPLCSIWSSDRGGPPPADAPVGCAICHLKSNLELPSAWAPPPTLVAELEFLLPRLVSEISATRVAPRALRGRAPPAIAA